MDLKKYLKSNFHFQVEKVLKNEKMIFKIDVWPCQSLEPKKSWYLGLGLGLEDQTQTQTHKTQKTQNPDPNPDPKNPKNPRLRPKPRPKNPKFLGFKKLKFVFNSIKIRLLTFLKI